MNYITIMQSTKKSMTVFYTWSDNQYKAWQCVWGHCPVEKQMVVQLSANQMGWQVAAECCGCHAGSVCLEF